MCIVLAQFHPDPRRLFYWKSIFSKKKTNPTRLFSDLHTHHAHVDPYTVMVMMMITTTMTSLEKKVPSGRLVKNYMLIKYN